MAILVPEPDSTLPELQVHTLDTKKVSHEAEDDPFNKSVKTLGGFGHNARRRRDRKMEKGHSSSDGEVESKKIEEEASAYNHLELVTPPYNLDYLAQMFEISEANFAAIHAKVANIVGLGYRFVETSKTKRKLDTASDDVARKRIRNNISKKREEIEDIFDSFNKHDTFQETLTKVYIDYESTGQGYMEIGRGAFGEIKYIGHISSTTMRVRRRRDGYVQITGREAVFFRNFGDKDVKNPIGDDDCNEVIIVQKYSPKSAFYGTPDFISAKNAIAGTEFAERYNLDYFENKAVPRYLITLKGATLGGAHQKNLLEFFETGLKGKNHRTLFVPLPPDTPDNKVDFSIAPIEAKIQDQSFEKYFKTNLLKTLMAHRVPLNKVSSAEGMSQSTAIESNKTFKNEVCMPAQRILAKKMNGIVKELTDVFLLEFNELNLTDADTLSKIEEREIRNQLRTPNEIRADHGRVGLPGGDKVVEQKPQQKAEAKSQQGATRTRDAERSAGTSGTNADGRAPKGTGRNYS